MRIAFELSKCARDLTPARIRLGHPDWNEPRSPGEWIRIAFFLLWFARSSAMTSLEPCQE